MGPRCDRALVQGQFRIRDDQVGVHLEMGPEPVAAFARSVGGVEREVSWRELVETDPAVDAGEVLGEHDVLGDVVDEVDCSHSLGQLERGFERVGKARVDAGLDHEPVDHDIDVVRVVAVELQLVGQLLDFAVDPRADETAPHEVLEESGELALAAPHHRCQHLEASAFGKLQDLVDDLLWRLPSDGPPALVAVGPPDAGIEQAHVVVDLGDGPDGGAGAAWRRLLVYRDRRREALDEVDVGLVHLAEELAGIGRQ